MESKEAFVRKNTIVLSFAGRLGLIILACTLNMFHLLEDVFRLLLFLMLPVTSLYTTLFLKFIFQNKYQRRGRELNKEYTAAGFYLLLLLNLVGIGAIVLKSADTTNIDDNVFYLVIALAEAGLSVYAGFYLADLFANKTPTQIKKTIKTGADLNVGSPAYPPY